MSKLLLVFICIYFPLLINAQTIDYLIKQYYKSETFLEMQKTWQIYRKAIESALADILKDSNGHRDMNVYIRQSPDSAYLTDGLFIYDNTVTTLLYDMKLVNKPYILYPQVTFALASNFLQIYATMGDILAAGNYRVFSNHTINGTDQDPNKQSPFTFGEVMPSGYIAIRASKCQLSAVIEAKLYGQSVILGYSNFKLINCHVIIEVNGAPGSPPVIAPYFSANEVVKVEKMLLSPIRERVLTILKPAMFTHVNTSRIFQDKLPKYISSQDSLFGSSAKYVQTRISSAIRNTWTSNTVKLPVPSYFISWRNVPAGPRQYASVEGVTVNALDSLFSTFDGGPRKTFMCVLSDVLYFRNLIVSGNLILRNKTHFYSYKFTAVMKDTMFNMRFDVDNKMSLQFIYITCRSIIISLVPVVLDERFKKRAFINAYLQEELPILLSQHLYDVFTRIFTDNQSNQEETNVDHQSNQEETNVDNQSNQEEPDVDNESNQEEPNVDNQSNQEQSYIDNQSNQEEINVDNQSSQQETIIDNQSSQKEPNVDNQSTQQETNLDNLSNQQETNVDNK